MSNRSETQAILNSADLIFDENACQTAVTKIAQEITKGLGEDYPLVLPVMGGAVVFTGQLLPLLQFPLDFDYIHVSRYGDKLAGGEFNWLRAPQSSVEGRAVLVLDDILDEGHTMAAIRDSVMALGAKSFHCAVFANKLIDKPKPIEADFIGLDLPNRYVFGFGMDVRGAWRNLPAVYALK